MNSPIGSPPMSKEFYLKYLQNQYLVDGTLLLETNNFGNITVSGDSKNRKMLYKVILPDGSIKYEFELLKKL